MADPGFGGGGGGGGGGGRETIEGVAICGVWGRVMSGAAPGRVHPSRPARGYGGALSASQTPEALQF